MRVESRNPSASHPKGFDRIARSRRVKRAFHSRSPRKARGAENVGHVGIFGTIGGFMIRRSYRFSIASLSPRDRRTISLVSNLASPARRPSMTTLMTTIINDNPPVPSTRLHSRCTCRHGMKGLTARKRIRRV